MPALLNAKTSILCRYLLVIALVLPFEVFSQSDRLLHSPFGKMFFEQDAEGTFVWKQDLGADSTDTAQRNPRAAAIALDLTLGLFGAHRLYLGTDVKVPVFYTCTIGGGMLLWVTDLGFLIFTKDLTPFYNNPNIFMWVPKKEKG